jgi:hypothetical protein
MFGGKQYYGLVAGLRQYTIDAGRSADGGSGYAERGFDADAVYGEIRRELSHEDRRAAALLWSLTDIYGLSRERIEQLYRLCAASKCEFLREWARFDRNLRNVIAAHTARDKGLAVADSLLSIEGDEIPLSLAKSTAADFGLRGELDYIDSLLTAMDGANVVEKERAIDLVRWDKADSLSEFDSFGAPTLLAYLVKIAVIRRWAVLDPATGREMYKRLVEGMKNEE